MTAPDHLKITRPEDVLGFIPHSLGYWPSDSLVAMTMQGKRLGATLRVDLPGDGSPGGSARFARTVAGYLEADDKADGALLAFFTGSDLAIAGADGAGGQGARGQGAGEDGAAWAVLLEELEQALAESGMPVRDAWLIGDKHWRNAYCTDLACCVPPGRPIHEITNSPLSAEMVYRGSTVGPAPGADVPRPPALPVDPELLEAERHWFGLLSGRTRDRSQFSRVLDVWTLVLKSPAEPRLPVQLAGYLRASLRVPAWRDAVLVMAAASPDAAEQGAAEFEMFNPSAPRPGRAAAQAPVLPPLAGFPSLLPGNDAAGGGAGGPQPGRPAGAPAVPGYGEVLLGLAPSVPDWRQLASLDRILVQLGGSGGEAGAAALTGRGWIEWCRGKGSFADALFNQAQAEHPGYRLAALLAELVNRGTVCGWAAQRDSAWQKFEPAPPEDQRNAVTAPKGRRPSPEQARNRKS